MIDKKNLSKKVLQELEVLEARTEKARQEMIQSFKDAWKEKGTLKSLIHDIYREYDELEAYHLMDNYMKALNKGGNRERKLTGMQEALKFTINILLDAKPDIFNGRSKTEIGRAVWIYLSEEICGRKESFFQCDKSLIQYKPNLDAPPEDDLAGEFIQLKDSQGRAHKPKSITFGKHFIENVTDVLKELAQK